MNYYRCGQIMTTHGLKGEVKVKSFSDFDRFSKGKRLFIFHKEQYIEVIVHHSSIFGKNLLVAFENMLDINLIEKYHGDELFISEDDRQDDLSEDEFYHTDLIGKEVVNQNNEPRGVVIEIKTLPASDYLIVSYQGKKVYIPFIDEFILEVGNKIEVNEIEGLF